ncbi:MAG TPA: PAS domain-containing protein [Dokdonella sp.]|uniref:PAS domain-containing protein n=1 Tax=Dokdonella sp. TaxID=2291710 RepID=UPI002D807155|nr:PAS domain-containing protein [Dokdonella sp.]HET9033552.1 PAS domain-containing protein [Dokdonella sp.]
MIEKQDTSVPVAMVAQSTTPELDVWGQLAEYASRVDADPVLRLLIDEASEKHRNLRGVTATIAHRYRALIDAVPDAITIHDENGRTLDVNATACSLLNQDRDALLGRLIVEIFPEVGADFLQDLLDTGDRGAILARSSTLVHVDAPPSAIELNARFYLDGQQKRIIVATRDLGPREYAHEQLRRSEAELRDLLRNMDKGVIVRNRRGHIVASNPTACRLLQMSEPDLLAMRSDQLGDWRFVDENNRPIDNDALPWSRAMSTGKPVESSICGLSSPNVNATLWVTVTAIPRFGSDKRNPEEVVSIFADITPIKQDASLFAHVQALTNLGAWQLISGTDRMIWSAKMHAIFDVPASTPTSLDRMLSHFTSDDQRRLRQALEAARSEQTTEITARITTAIGRKRQIRIRARALDPESASGDVIGCVQDVTGESESDVSISPE